MHINHTLGINPHCMQSRPLVASLYHYSARGFTGFPKYIIEQCFKYKYHYLKLQITGCRVHGNATSHCENSFVVGHSVLKNVEVCIKPSMLVGHQCGPLGPPASNYFVQGAVCMKHQTRPFPSIVTSGACGGQGGISHTHSSCEQFGPPEVIPISHRT